MADDTLTEDKNESLLKQIRDDFRYVKEYWRENHEESAKDMNVVACIPPPEFTADRAGRPCIWPDETSQYVKQANNNLRQNKRSVKISPRSEGADAKDAEHRQAYIRGIEYASNAQSIYTTAFEAAVECAFGFWRIVTKITGPKGEQEPRIRRIQNQFTVYLDPDACEADFSDGSIAFVLNSMRESTFARKYPKAKKRSFTTGDRELAADWFPGNNDIIVGEYWSRAESEAEDGEKVYKVTQYITNGVEILETNEWIGSWIPIIGVFGEEIYIRESGQSKRIFLSLIRRARAPQQMIAYVASQEAEEFQMAPRAPLQGYKGMFDPKQHKDLHRVPRSYVEYTIPLNWNPQWGAPPLPSRSAFTVNFEAYEAAYERYRRAVMSAMGITPLPTAAQRQNEKSGIALEKIQDQEAIGSFHCTDNFVRALGNSGRQIDELITKLAELDSLPKQLLGKDQKDEDRTIHIVPRDDERQKAFMARTQLDPADSEHLDESDVFFAHRGKFEIAVSDGPSRQSQREDAGALADKLLEQIPAMGLPPQIAQQVLAIAIKLKNIGSYGDEIADLLAPPDPNNLPRQAKALVAQAQGQIQQLTQEVQELRLKQLGKVTEIQGKMALQEHEAQTRMAEADKDRETKLGVAEIMTKAQSISERLDMVMDLMKQGHEQAHDRASSRMQQAHEKEMADQQNAITQQQTAQQAALQPPPAEAAAS